MVQESELVVRQMEGRYRVKHPDMIPLHSEARSLLARFDEALLTHVPREENREADRCSGSDAARADEPSGTQTSDSL